VGFLKRKFGLAYLGIIRWRSSLANAEFMSRHLYKADFAPALLAKSACLRAVCFEHAQPGRLPSRTSLSTTCRGRGALLLASSQSYARPNNENTSVNTSWSLDTIIWIVHHHVPFWDLRSYPKYFLHLTCLANRFPQTVQHTESGCCTVYRPARNGTRSCHILMLMQPTPREGKEADVPSTLPTNKRLIID
jgi:hypothetical protein